MRQKRESKGQSRRAFFTGLLAGAGGVAALLSTSKEGRSAVKKPTVPTTDPILYRRTPETERYYRTLYL